MTWPHMARHRDTGNAVKPWAFAAKLGACEISLPQTYPRIGREDGARKLHGDIFEPERASSIQPDRGSGMYQVRHLH